MSSDGSIHGERHPWLRATAKICIGRPYAVLTIGAVVAFGLAPCAVQFIPDTKLAIDPVKEFESTKAQELVLKYFPTQADKALYVIIVALKGSKKKYATSSMLSTGSAESGSDKGCQYSEVECIHRFWQHGVWPSLLKGVQSALESTLGTVHHEHGQTERYGGRSATAPILDVPGLAEFSFALNESLSRHKRIFDYTSNATLWAAGIATTALLNKEGTATQITFRTNDKTFDTAALDFAGEAHDIAERVVRKYLPEGDIDWGLSSTSGTIRASIDDAQKTSFMMDVTSLPLAALVFWYMLGSARLVLVPVITVCFSITISYGVMYIVGQSAEVVNNTPPMMMSLSIAMTIDYCLFILSRFREELMKSTGQDVQTRVADATAIAMETGGWAVFVSGTVLAASFTVMACFPMPGWQTYGAGGAIALCAQLLVHLTILPAILQITPEFFARCAPPEDPAVQSAAAGELQQTWVDRLWRRIASLSSDPLKAVLILFIVTGITVLVGYRFADMTLGAESQMFLPKDTDAWDGYVLMEKHFGKGPLLPFQLLMMVDGDKYDSIVAQEPWEDSQRVLKSIVDNMPHTRGLGVASISYSFANGESVSTSWSQVASCMQVLTAFTPTCIELLGLAAQYISPGRQALLASVTLEIDPLSEPGREFTKRLRDLLDKAEKTTVFNFALAGGGTATVDLSDKFHDVFPYVVMTTCILAILILAICFRSIVYPFTCMFTILLTLLFTYGLAVRIYQDSFLEWTGVASLRNRFDALPVGTNIGAFTIIVGLCLDYDIFLISRITEFRAKGMPATEAIVEGLCSSGGIITAAGTIMAVAFTGPMYCTSVYLTYISAYYFAASVLYDTFIVRSFVVPAAMTILGRFNWWPSELAYDKTD